MKSGTRSHVHALVDRLPPAQLAAVEVLLQSMVDPFERKLATAEVDDEPFTEEDRRAVAEADQWTERNGFVPLEGVLADFGLTIADWETMAQTPLDKPLPVERK